MLTHLRLAQARGSLVAPNSPVQDRALEYLDMVAEVQRHEGRLDFVKGLLVRGSDYDFTKAQFPEFFPDDPFEQIKTEDGTYDIDLLDDAAVEWGVPDEEEDEALSQWIAAQESGSFTGAEIE